MNILIFTQTVNRKDSTLGFFHNWLIEFSKHFEHLLVGALRVGEYDLPENVTIVPLRPVEHRARLVTSWRVLKLAWSRRRDYDAVFVHMNQEYLLVAGWLWKLLGKKVYLWRNHNTGNWMTDVAASFCDKVFYTSRFSYTAKYAQGRQMPVGVDVDALRPDESIAREPHSILFLGRFDAEKHPDVLMEALGIIHKKGIAFTASFVGGPSDPNSPLPQQMVERAGELGIRDAVTFVGPVPSTETYRYHRSHTVYVNCAKSGMLDKSLFKAIVCGALPVFVSDDLAEIIGDEFKFAVDNGDDLAEHLMKAFALSDAARAEIIAAYERKAIGQHTLPVLARRIAEELGA